ncbi:GroES-like protein [Mytilinidion resinicola]|uniref:GroES-like protein n=1 Tax=Mytilinidion resinicola TaxID=574789 RepID=A0A6A6YW32_9PEZI|nr:GroES-like protein [Mytilinidion resinicola]KAF2813166.1 GroES-like protein [Mytilinidion resinicola]
MRTGKVVVFTAPSKPLEIRTEPSPDPSADQVVVRVSIAGVCGSDAHRLSGDYPAPSQPICFGHEGVGVVEALGSNITSDRAGTPLAVGDRISWLPATPCGDCEACELSTPMFCKDINWPAPAGTPNAATYREFATLGARNIYYRIPDTTSLESVIAFGCAMPTALRGFAKLGQSVGSDVVIQGSGPVGLAMTVLASLAGAKTIIVTGGSKERLDAARKLGATETLSVRSTSVEERRERVKVLTKGRMASVVVEAAGVPEAFPEGLDLLGMNGKYLIAGLYSGKAVYPVDAVRIVNYNLQIIGSVGIEPEHYLKTVQIATEHGSRLGFADLITHRFPLSDLEEAIRSARMDSVKTVVVP